MFSTDYRVSVWVSAFELSNNKMAMVDVGPAAYRRTYSPSRLAWSEGRSAANCLAFVKWTLAVTLSQRQHYKHHPGIIIIIITVGYKMFFLIPGCIRGPFQEPVILWVEKKMLRAENYSVCSQNVTDGEPPSVTFWEGYISRKQFKKYNFKCLILVSVYVAL